MKVLEVSHISEALDDPINVSMSRNVLNVLCVLIASLQGVHEQAKCSSHGQTNAQSEKKIFDWWFKFKTLPPLID